ncbi:MAG: DNA polymerase III subunit gamma/tau [Lachnospiraceae bacterium]|nr:DNA polymerase III subunit gamma/tau [Lachnospiraceae bacterium]
MAYQALYRKWRPDNFEDVKGQDHIVTTLRNQIKASHIGHAYLLTGTRGTGKTTIAKIMAKAVNCENPKEDGSPCNECAVCKAINEQRYPYVHEIDAASNTGVDSVREIINNIIYSPTEGKYIVYIIDEVHMVSPSAFNALLKTLEEPPEYAIFILATTDPQKIPVTILSRCQRYDFKRITINTITDRLKELMANEGINVSEDALKYVAKAGDGSMRDSLSLLDQCISFYLGQDIDLEKVVDVLGAVNSEVLSKIYNDIVNSDVSSLMNYVEDLIMDGRELSSLVDDFIQYLRNILLAKEAPEVADIMELPTEQWRLIVEDSKKCDTDILIRYIRETSELSNRLKISSQKRVDVEIAFVKMCKPQMQTDIESLHQRIADLEKELASLKEMAASGTVVTKELLENVSSSQPAATTEAMPESLDEALKDLAPADKETIEQLVVNYAKFKDIYAKEDPVGKGVLDNARLCKSDKPATIRLVFERDSQRLLIDNFKDGLENCLKGFLKRDINILYESVNDKNRELAKNVNLITLKVEEA